MYITITGTHIEKILLVSYSVRCHDSRLNRVVRKRLPCNPSLLCRVSKFTQPLMVNGVHESSVICGPICMWTLGCFIFLIPDPFSPIFPIHAIRAQPRFLNPVLDNKLDNIFCKNPVDFLQWGKRI